MMLMGATPLYMQDFVDEAVLGTAEEHTGLMVFGFIGSAFEDNARSDWRGQNSRSAQNPSYVKLINGVAHTRPLRHCALGPPQHK
jgi:hypothetical protein